MGRRYSITAATINTASITQWVLTSATTVRPELYDMVIGSVATPADNAGSYQLKRFTAAGTTTAWTPIALDPGDPASLSAAGFTASIEPTYTANAVLLQFATNQRATFRWVSRDRSEIKFPATSANGGGLFTLGTTSAVIMTYTTLFEE
jgi:hypothetical protein